MQDNIAFLILKLTSGTSVCAPSALLLIISGFSFKNLSTILIMSSPNSFALLVPKPYINCNFSTRVGNSFIISLSDLSLKMQ